MSEFIDNSGKKKDGNNCCGIDTSRNMDPDPTSNIENCYHCAKPSCSCENGKDYNKELVKKITDKVLREMSS